jgi:N-acyl-D-aspartate/D-glutamate deacylase
MPEYDLVIRGGTIVDGTGIPRYRADLAVRNGRIEKISGRISSGGAKEIDASGCIVAPGAIDLHTHYDAQLNWDPYASLSGWFGVTSLTIGQCGFGFAPTRPEDRDLNMRMMNRIEAIPLESMRLGIRWDWETFPEFMDSLDRQGLGVNVGALFPFSPLRGYVMGMMPSRERPSATEVELNRMRQLFYEGMKAGAFGFSTQMNLIDRPEDGGFLPSQVASDEEFLALAEVLGEFGVGHIGHTEGFDLTQEQHKSLRELMARMMRVSGRPLHVNIDEGEDPSWIQACRAEGLPLVLQRLCTIGGIQFKLAEFNLFDRMRNWVQPLVGTPEERAAKLRDPGTRVAMKRDVEESAPAGIINWGRMSVLEVVHERNYKYEGLTIQELAEITGQHPLDAFLDLALDEGLETEFMIPPSSTEDALKLREAKIKDPYAHISQSDGGAHTRYLTMSNWPVFWLSFWVRDREIMSLEEAHYKISALPAWLADFKDRGILRTGAWADIIVYNQEELGFVYDRPVFANDFPGGERRLIQKPTGLRNIIVNGAVTFEGNDCTGALPGKLLRSYDMVG